MIVTFGMTDKIALDLVSHSEKILARKQSRDRNITAKIGVRHGQHIQPRTGQRVVPVDLFPQDRGEHLAGQKGSNEL